MRDAATYLQAATPPARRAGPWSTHFLDLSNNNGAEVELRTVAHNSRVTGITGTELKASEGVDFRDPLFPLWRRQAAELGLRVMPYHFARPDQHSSDAAARQEADHFCNVVGKLHPWEWRPMLDFETAPFHASWVRAFNRRVHERLGVWPVLYSYFAALDGMALSNPLSAGLVLAYPNGLPASAPCPKPWRHWTAHQYSWHGVVAGVPGRVDLNWTPSVRALLAFPVRGAAYEPIMRARRRKA